jgi:hypothetical protein
LFSSFRITLTEIHSLIRFHTIAFVLQLQEIYQIKPGNDDHPYTINGIPLPNSDFTGCDEEQVAVALGHVCHILTLLAKYLNV